MNNSLFAKTIIALCVVVFIYIFGVKFHHVVPFHLKQ